MRQILALSFLLLAGCDVLQAKSTHAPFCTTMAPASLVNNWNHGDFSDDRVEELSVRSRALADCLILQSRQLSGTQDVTSVVARGVLSACQAETSKYVDAYQTAHLGSVLETHDPVGYAQQLELLSKELEKSTENVAIRYVLEARVGKCEVIRREISPTPVNDPIMPDIV